MRVAVKLAVVCALLVNLAGCGYALTGRGSAMPSYIRTVGVPVFLNATPVYDLEQKLTERVRLEMVSRGKYKVQPDEAGTDAVLTGEVVSVAIQPTAFNSEQLASRYAFNLVVKVTFVDTKTKKTLYENPSLTFREEYEVSSGTVANDPASFLGQNTQALDRIANDFARTVVASILEAF
jgi:predicted transcriptional regulator of viral defense system